MSGPPDISGMISLKVDLSDPHRMPDKWNKDELIALFEKYGEIGDVFIPRDRNTGMDRPFGFVRYYKEDDAEDAIKALDGHKLQGVEIAVAKAKKSREEAFAATRGAAEGYGDDRGRGRGRSDSRRRGRRSPPRRIGTRCDSRSRSPPPRRRDGNRRHSPPPRRRDSSRRRGRR